MRSRLADASVDGVIVQAVLEHVLDPRTVAAEVERVLRPRGMVYAETPLMQQVHEGHTTSRDSQTAVTDICSVHSRGSTLGRSRVPVLRCAGRWTTSCAR